MISLQNFKLVCLSVMLGIALGSGWMTSLRFGNLVGISEILFALVGFLLFSKLKNSFFSFSRNVYGVTKLYFMGSVFLLAPLITFLSAFLFGLSDLVAFHYVPAFILGVSLMFLIPLAIARNIIDMKIVTLIFCVVFLITYMLSIYLMPTDVLRFSGFSKNPNQPLFYLMSLGLLLSFYQKKIFFLTFPLLIWAGLKSGSDAFVFSSVLVLVSYLSLKINYSEGRLRITAFCSTIIAFLLVLFCSVNLVEILIHWFLAADEGNLRPLIFKNGMIAALQSPLFGWGIGSFSGISVPFQGMEAHSNFIDLSMQFGIPFALAVYWLVFRSFCRLVRLDHILPAAMLLGFAASSLIHFSARHFVFWVELGVLLAFLNSAPVSASLHQRLQIIKR